MLERGHHTKRVREALAVAHRSGVCTAVGKCLVIGVVVVVTSHVASAEAAAAAAAVVDTTFTRRHQSQSLFHLLRSVCNAASPLQSLLCRRRRRFGTAGDTLQTGGGIEEAI